MNKREVSICIKEFEKFYELLMREAPKGYNPWFFACEPNGKNPVLGLSWHDEKARLTKEQCIEAIKQGFNLGISARKDDPLIIGDIDEEIYLEQLPKDTLTTTSRKRIGAHFFGWNKDGTAKINLPTDSGELRSDNQYVLACGSYVPFNISEKKDKLIQETFDAYLKHIQTLEKMVNPKQDRFTQHVLSPVIPISEIPNEIEKTEEDIKEESFQEVLSKIPITHKTKVSFENEQLPEEVIF